MAGDVEAPVAQRVADLVRDLGVVFDQQQGHGGLARIAPGF
jgi:hypothetical protein